MKERPQFESGSESDSSESDFENVPPADDSPNWYHPIEVPERQSKGPIETDAEQLNDFHAFKALFEQKEREQKEWDDFIDKHDPESEDLRKQRKNAQSELEKNIDDVITANFGEMDPSEREAYKKILNERRDFEKVALLADNCEMSAQALGTCFQTAEYLFKSVEYTVDF